MSRTTLRLLAVLAATLFIYSVAEPALAAGERRGRVFARGELGTLRGPDDGQAARSLLAAQRSLLGALFYLSHAIAVPAVHVEAGLVTVTRDEHGRPFDWGQVTGDLLHVRSGPGRPHGAAVAVPYRGHWFYIDDADLSSKSTFALLVELFSLQSAPADGDAPVLTLPIGG